MGKVDDASTAPKRSTGSASIASHISYYTTFVSTGRLEQEGMRWDGRADCCLHPSAGRSMRRSGAEGGEGRGRGRCFGDITRNGKRWRKRGGGEWSGFCPRVEQTKSGKRADSREQ